MGFHQPGLFLPAHLKLALMQSRCTYVIWYTYYTDPEITLV
jgi:hypothetical protein